MNKLLKNIPTDLKNIVIDYFNQLKLYEESWINCKECNIKLFNKFDKNSINSYFFIKCCDIYNCEDCFNINEENDIYFCGICNTYQHSECSYENHCEDCNNNICYDCEICNCNDKNI